MTTATPSTALATIQPASAGAGRLATAGFLAGYRGLSREACALDLRQFTTWCRARSLGLFAGRRADIESFASGLEARSRARATVTRRLCTIAGFYKHAVEEELLDHSPARCRWLPVSGHHRSSAREELKPVNRKINDNYCAFRSPLGRRTRSASPNLDTAATPMGVRACEEDPGRLVGPDTQGLPNDRDKMIGAGTLSPGTTVVTRRP